MSWVLAGRSKLDDNQVARFSAQRYWITGNSLMNGGFGPGNGDCSGLSDLSNRIETLEMVRDVGATNYGRYEGDRVPGP